MEKSSTATSPLLFKFLNAYEANPNSKVFAPLAETYRKLGMINEALKILKRGIKNHPQYTIGYVSLASCYFDQNKFDLAYNTLMPLVANNLDNIRLQKLFADTCLSLGHDDEALSTLKYLLFINPRDKAVAQKVAMLEEKLRICTVEQARDPIEANSTDTLAVFKIESLRPEPFSNESDPESDENEWVQLDLSQKKKTQKQEAIFQGSPDETDWKIVRPKVFESNELDAEELDEKELNEEESSEGCSFSGVENEGDYERVLEISSEQDVIRPQETSPLMTHTLVDLYRSQGLNSKAIEILEKIIEINPSDMASLEKLNQLKKEAYASDTTNDEGRNRLMEAFDKVNSKSIEVAPEELSYPVKDSKSQKIINRLESFLLQLKLRPK